MVIPQVFGSSRVLYRVGAPLFAYSALCALLLSAAVRGDALHYRCKATVLTRRFQAARRLPRRLRGSDWDPAMPSLHVHNVPRYSYGTILYYPAGTRRRPPTTRLGAVPTSVNRDTRPRSGTLVGAIEPSSPAPDKAGCQIDACRATVRRQHRSHVTERPRPIKGSQNHGARLKGHHQQKG